MRKELAVMVVVLLCLGVSGLQAASRVEREPAALMVRFDNGVRLELPIGQGERVHGIGRVWSGHTQLKPAEPTLLPVIELSSDTPAPELTVAMDAMSGPRLTGRECSRFTLRGVESDGEAVTLVLEAWEGDAPAGELRWRIEPYTARLFIATFTGFASTYHFTSAADPVVSFWERSAWAPGGTIEGTWTLESGHSFHYRYKKRLTTDGDLSLPEDYYEPAFKSYPELHLPNSQPSLFDYTMYNFRYLHGRAGVLVEYLSHPMAGRRWLEKNAGDDHLAYYHKLYVNHQTRFSSPRFVVMFSAGVDDPTPLSVESWHGTVFDYVNRQQCAHYGAAPAPRMTMAMKAYPQCVEPMDLRADEAYLRRAHDWHFRSIWYKGWEDASNNRRRYTTFDTPWHIRAGDSFGGEDMARRFCTRARELDVKVVMWTPTLYLAGRSSVVQDHPEWVVRDEGGIPEMRRHHRDAGVLRNYGPVYEEIVQLNAWGYGDYWLRSILHMHELGVAGIWIDSFPGSMVDSGRHYAHRAHPTWGSTRIHQLIGELLKRGVYVSFEGAGPLGQAAGGSLDAAVARSTFGYHRIYGWQILYWSPSYITEDQVVDNTYYKSCANKSPCIIPISAGEAPIHANCPRQQAHWIIAANRDYNAVVPFMQYRTLIPSDHDPEEEKAVLWTSEDRRTLVLFAYEAISHPLPENVAAVRDVTSGKDVATATALVTEPWHTYLIRMSK